MIKMGLTGGIGSGKSAVSNYFAELGVPIIDADVIARNLVKVNNPAYLAIIEHFGKNILQLDKEIDRKKLRQLVFSNKKQRLALENILHPLVRAQIKTEISLLHSKYCIVVIPLLIESRQTQVVDKILVVDTPISLQISRTIQRDSTTQKEVEQIMSVQVDNKTRQSAADFIIENAGSLDQLREEVKKMHLLFSKLKLALVED